MDILLNAPEFLYLSPTTRERAIAIAKELLATGNFSPKEAISNAAYQARDWATRNINRSIWKRLKKNDKESL